MKNLKKFVSVVMAIAMVFTLMLPAMAASSSDGDGDDIPLVISTYTYDILQVFTGDYSSAEVADKPCVNMYVMRPDIGDDDADADADADADDDDANLGIAFEFVGGVGYYNGDTFVNLLDLYSPLDGRKLAEELGSRIVFGHVEYNQSKYDAEYGLESGANSSILNPAGVVVEKKADSVILYFSAENGVFSYGSSGLEECIGFNGLYFDPEIVCDTVKVPDMVYGDGVTDFWPGNFSLNSLATRPDVTTCSGHTLGRATQILSNVKYGQNGAGVVGTAVPVEDLAKLEAATGDNKALLDVITNYVDFDTTPYQSDLTQDEINDLTGVPAGYYLIRSCKVTGDGAHTTYVVRVVDGSFDFNPKQDAPTVTKTIDGKSLTNAAIGDDVEFTVTATLPSNLYDYKEYYLKLTDTMTDGLVYNNDAVIMWGDVDITNNFAISNKDGVTVFELNNLFDTKQANGKMDDIVITYSANVTTDAVIGGENINTVKLEYSNDPNNSENGKDSIGETLPSDTKTWITGLTVEVFTKEGKPLPGTEFKLTGENINTVIKYTSQFVPSKTGMYYKLVDGGYTSMAPTDEIRDLYDMDAGMFDRVDSLDTINEDGVEITAVIDENGMLSIFGLKAGDYVLENTKIPDGYNLADDIEFTISFDEDDLFSSNNTLVAERTPEWFYVTIIVGRGSMLPETGGAGVVAMYALGVALVIGAVSVLVIKKKKSV